MLLFKILDKFVMHYNLLLQIDGRSAFESTSGVFIRTPERVEEADPDNMETAEVQGTAWN